jgi:transcriptional regulator with XRE-family HTH domain
MEVLKKTIQTTNDLGEFMKSARERSGLTIEAVALKSGFTTQTIANLEKNRGSVNLNTLLAVATTIGVKVEVNYEDRKNIKIRELTA